MEPGNSGPKKADTLRTEVWVRREGAARRFPCNTVPENCTCQMRYFAYISVGGIGRRREVDQQRCGGVGTAASACSIGPKPACGRLLPRSRLSGRNPASCRPLRSLPRDALSANKRQRRCFIAGSSHRTSGQAPQTCRICARATNDSMNITNVGFRQH